MHVLLLVAVPVAVAVAVLVDENVHEHEHASRGGVEGLGGDGQSIGMQCISRTPTGGLGRVVERIWHFRSDSVAGQERILPNVSGQLLVNLRVNRLTSFDDPAALPRLTGGVVVCGPRTRPLIVDASEQRLSMGAVFRTGGMTAIFGLCAQELIGQPIDLTDLWGEDGARLRHELAELDAPAARLAHLEGVLCARLLPEQIVSGPLLAAIRLLESGARVGAVRERLGMSSTRFVQMLRQGVGLNPKTLTRVARFREAVTRVGPQTDWSDVAAACGYFDQAHFIHDFREFAGVRPTDYAPRSWKQRSHVPLAPPT